MPLSLFGSFGLTLCLFWVWSYSIFVQHFASHNPVQDEIAFVKKQTASAHLALRVAQEELFVYQQQVASFLPDMSPQLFKGEKGYPLRQLASVGPSRDQSLADKLSTTLLLRGKSLFNERKYPESIKALALYVERYPYSAAVVEAHFLMVEASFRMGEYEQSSTLIKKMVSLFPENELTGLSLIRLGQIFEHDRRPDEAAEIYQTVLRSFPQREVASQALEAVKRVQY